MSGYTKSSVDIIRSVVLSMTFPIKITDVTLNSTGNYTIKVNNIYHAQPGFPIAINSNVYQIIDIGNCSLTITGTILPIVGQTFELYKPFFFHGTPRATALDLKQTIEDENALLKTPMIWFIEVFKDKLYKPIEYFDRDIITDLCFLSQADHDQWLTDEAYKYVVEPMRRLVENFIRALQSYPNIFYTENYAPTITNYAKFGVYIKDQGVLQNMFADKLGGCMINEPITVIKEYNCKCCEEDCGFEIIRAGECCNGVQNYWRQGNSAPTDSLGINNDVYVQNGLGIIWHKENGHYINAGQFEQA